jgi:hypothetical protein
MHGFCRKKKRNRYMGWRFSKRPAIKARALGGDIFGLRTRRNGSKSGKSGNGNANQRKKHIGTGTIAKIGWQK